MKKNSVTLNSEDNLFEFLTSLLILVRKLVTHAFYRVYCECCVTTEKLTKRKITESLQCVDGYTSNIRHYYVKVGAARLLMKTSMKKEKEKHEQQSNSFNCNNQPSCMFLEHGWYNYFYNMLRNMSSLVLKILTFFHLKPKALQNTSLT